PGPRRRPPFLHLGRRRRGGALPSEPRSPHPTAVPAVAVPPPSTVSVPPSPTFGGGDGGGRLHLRRDAPGTPPSPTPLRPPPRLATIERKAPFPPWRSTPPR